MVETQKAGSDLVSWNSGEADDADLDIA